MAEAALPSASRTLSPSALAARLARLRGWRRFLVLVFAGAAATLALPPVYAWPVLLVAVPVLIWTLDGTTTSAGAFWVGWSFGFGYFVAGLYWIGFALAVDLERFFWAIPLAVTGLQGFLAIFIGLATLVSRLIGGRGLGRLLVFAALWAMAEWLRGHVLTGFPWNLVGYTWVGWLPVLQSVSWLGIYGLSLLTMLLAALPAAFADTGEPRHRLIAGGLLAAGVVLFAGLWLHGAARLADAPSDSVPGVVLRLVQPNIAQAEKWDLDLRDAHIRLQMDLSLDDTAGRATHVIWPETAVAYFLEPAPGLRRVLGDLVPPGGHVLLGAPRTNGVEGEARRYWNSLYALDRDGTVAAVYDKFHLVPFGEYVPWRDLLPIDKITPGTVDYTPGPGPRTVSLPGLPPFSPLICYEAIFPGAVTTDGGPSPRWLLNVTNDAWYGITAGPHQHFAIARTRGVEEGLPLVRVATTGISGVVDAYGRVTARLELGERGAVDAELPQAPDLRTAYARWGDGPFWGLAVALLVVGLALSHRPAMRSARR